MASSFTASINEKWLDMQESIYTLANADAAAGASLGAAVEQGHCAVTELTGALTIVRLY